jgi:uncharacterized protein YjbI with pentapeptide repeats
VYLQLLDADPAWSYYDFAEFVFVGSELSGPGEHIFSIEDTGFRKHGYFVGATFIDSFMLTGVDFQEGGTFREATFAKDLIIKNSRFKGLDFFKAKLTRCAFFTEVGFLSYAIFQAAHFTGTRGGYAVKFESSRFHGITNFSGAFFTLGDDR